jgi:methionyl-tRNA formyltransferase
MFVFFGSSIHSAYFLELGVKNGLKIDLVVSNPPKLLGRKKILTENPTVSAAKKLGIPYLLDLRGLEKFQNLKLGLILDYNKIIPGAFIDLFEKGIINVHFSKLPEYRGPSPVQQTILDAKTKAHISYFLISEKLDQGNILFQSEEDISQNENTGSLYLKLTEKASKEIKKMVSNYLSGKLVPQPQKGKASYTKKFTAEDCKIDWQKPDEYSERLVRACSPEPGTWTQVRIGPQVKRLKILSAQLEQGKFVPLVVQLEGKNPVMWKQFWQGYPNAEIIKEA